MKDADRLPGAVSLAHHFLKERLGEGDSAADATCGNGRDTLLLARLVGDSGRVWAFDIQPDAVRDTRTLLAEAGLIERVEIVCAGHENLSLIIGEPLKAIVFNLGYLPGKDRDITTRPEQTIPALKQAAALLLPGGLITVCVYTGHGGGAEEATAVEGWASSLSGDEFNAWTCRQPNRSSSAPYLVLVEKR